MRTLPWEVSPDLPWKTFTSPAEQWANQPTFLIGEYVIIICAALALIHAVRAGRSNRLTWVAALIAGTANDVIFMALPVVDTFWQAQATIMITPRLPLYIPCVYIVFLYWPTVGIRRLGLGRWPAAALTGLVAVVLYAPYDIVGAKFLWWTWHDTDPAIADRLFGAPLSSSLWVLTFTGSFALLLDLVLRGREVTEQSFVTRRRFVAGIVLAACITTPLMMAQMFVLQLLDGGTPGLVAFCTGAVIYGSVSYFGRRAARPEGQPVDWLGRGAAAYLIALVICMAFFAPETHVSSGLHQVPGPCGVEESDITGNTRDKYLCVEDYAEDFTFACTTPPAHDVQWYTVCGKEHSNYPAYVAVVSGLVLAGIAALYAVFGALGGSAGRPATPASARARSTAG